MDILIDNSPDFMLEVTQQLIEKKEWQCRTLIRPLILLCEKNHDVYFPKTKDLMQLMFEKGICQHFFNNQKQSSNSWDMQMFLRGTALYFTKTGNTNQERYMVYKVYETYVSEQIKKAIKK